MDANAARPLLRDLLSIRAEVPALYPQLKVPGGSQGLRTYV